MRISLAQAGDRREFFRAAARYALLALTGTAAAILGQRRLKSQHCNERGICNGCLLFADCGLPQALSAKLSRTGN